MKAAAVAPRPVDLLRPVVRCPTIKHNRRLRAGKGFTLAELKVRLTILIVRLQRSRVLVAVGMRGQLGMRILDVLADMLF